MLIRELLINGLISTNLFEMAFSKKVAIDRARDLQLQIARHLVKIIMYSESQYVSHWSSEVNTWLDKIQDHRLKGTNRPLSESELTNILFIEPLGTISDVQARMNRNYRDYPDLKIDQSDALEISKQLSWILPKICDDISNENFTDIRMYIEELK